MENYFAGPSYLVFAVDTFSRPALAEQTGKTSFLKSRSLSGFLH
jgi:hypothetical protein